MPMHSKVVALTIDDAPHPAVTPKILEALQTLGVKATFFVIGSQAERWPQLLLDIASQVHPPDGTFAMLRSAAPRAPLSG